MASHTSAEVASLVREQLAQIADQVLSARIREFLVEPYPVERDWDYGVPGQKYVCWTVLEHRPSNTAIAYCTEGFGDPWGLVFLSGPHMSMGMDAGWFLFLEDAFRSSAAWDGENPPGYEVR